MNSQPSATRARKQMGWIIAAMIVLAFVGVAIAKTGSKGAADSSQAPRTAPNAPSDAATVPSSVTTGPSQSHADAMAAYDAALRTGKPVYVLFHSLTCDPCKQISAVVDRVMPEYGGRVVFVNAITTDEPAMRLAAKFQFQYIPQSFFLDAKGQVVDSFTGAMDETAMKGYLDKLVTR